MNPAIGPSAHFTRGLRSLRVGVKPIANHEPEHESQSSRRQCVASAAAALIAKPAFGQSAAGGPAADVDVIIVGAGAAGIAAARRLSAAGRSFTLVEASGRIGGRCFTDTRSFSAPFDRGA